MLRLLISNVYIYLYTGKVKKLYERFKRGIDYRVREVNVNADNVSQNVLSNDVNPVYEMCTAIYLL